MAGSPNIDGNIGNIFENSHIVTREALMLLENSLVAAPLVWRVPEKYFGGAKTEGSTISIRKPNRVKSSTGRVITDHNPAVNQTIPFAIDHQEKVSFETSQVDSTLSIKNFMQEFINPGIINIANKLDETILLEAKKAFWTYGTPGTRPAYTDWAFADAMQTKLAVPADGNRRSIETPDTCASVNVGLGTKPNDPLTGQAIIKGYTGQLSEYERYKSNNLPLWETGAFGANDGSIQIDGANQTGPDLVLKGAPASTTGVVKAGDVFTIEGVYSVNPQSYQNNGMLQHFVVTEDADSDGAGAVTVKISPELNDGTATTTNPAGDTIVLNAYQNVTNYAADSAPVTFIGTEQTQYFQDFLFHKQAIGLAVVDMAMPANGFNSSRVRDSESGLSMCMTGAYDVIQNTNIVRLDCLWGTQMIYPELALRMIGAEAA